MSFFEINGIVNVHLITGEDIIGKLIGVEVDEFVIEKPVTPNMRGTAEGVQIGLLPLRPWLDSMNEIRIPRTSVVYSVPCSEKMANLYRQIITGITIASPSDIPAQSKFAI